MNESSTRVAASARSRGVGGLVADLLLACAELVRPRRAFADARVALRSLKKSPLFALSVVTLLSIVVGANAVIFTALYDTALKPLPYPDADRLAYVFNITDSGTHGASRGQYHAFREQADLFDSFALFTLSRMTIQQERVSGQEVSGDFFELLGLAPTLGRLLTDADCEPGRSPVMVIPESVWRTEYKADPKVVGETVEMNKTLYEIVGVAPDSVERVAVGARFFVPLVVEPWGREPRARHSYVRLSLMARLKPGVDMQAGLAQLTTIEERFLQDEAPAELRNRVTAGGWRMELGLPEFALTKSLVVLQAGSVALLLLACLNLGGLLVSRASHRSADLSIRYALGASRVSLLRAMIVESALLAGASAAIAVPVMLAGIQLYNSFVSGLPGASLTIEPRGAVVGGVACALALLAFAMGAVPFAIIWRSGLIDSNRPSSRGASSSRGVRLTRSSLVVAQLAFSLVLLVGASLLGKSFLNTLAVDLGLDPSRIISSRVAFTDDYKSRDQVVAARNQLVEKARGISGVDHVSCLTEFAVQEMARDLVVSVLDGTPSGEIESARINLKIVSRDFFDTLGIRFLEGGAFDEGGGLSRPPQVVVDRSFADRYLLQGKAIGSGVRFGTSADSGSFPIVGVTERANLQGQRLRDGPPVLYYPIDGVGGPGLTLLVRTDRPTQEIAKALRAILSSIDSGLPLYAVATLEDSVAELHQIPRMIMQLVVAFACVSLVISAIGLFSVVSYDVSQRGREIGIRKALGANRSQIVSMLVRQALAKAGLAVVIGLTVCYFAMRLLQSQLFDTSAFDIGVYFGVSVLVVAIALVASYLPSRRAAAAESTRSLQG